MRTLKALGIMMLLVLGVYLQTEALILFVNSLSFGMTIVVSAIIFASGFTLCLFALQALRPRATASVLKRTMVTAGKAVIGKGCYKRSFVQAMDINNGNVKQMCLKSLL